MTRDWYWIDDRIFRLFDKAREYILHFTITNKDTIVSFPNLHIQRKHSRTAVRFPLVRLGAVPIKGSLPVHSYSLRSTYFLPFYGMLPAIFSAATSRTEAVFYSETFEIKYQTTQYRNPKCCSMNIHRREKLRSYKFTQT
jgi:hypothetical protein